MNADRPNSASEASQRFRVDDLIVDLGQQEVRRNSSRLDVPKLSFDLFLALIRAAPNLLSIDELMERVWPGLVVNPETVTRRVKMLRDALGDDPDQPRYIGGLRGRGYRLVAPVSPEFGSPTQSRAVSMPQTPAGPSDRASKSQRGLRGTTWFVAGMLGLLTLGSIVVMRREWATEHARAVPQQFLVTARPPRSVAVLPFENLGAQPSDEYLALGISETLLNRLGAVPELLVLPRHWRRVSADPRHTREPLARAAQTWTPIWPTSKGKLCSHTGA